MENQEVNESNEKYVKSMGYWFKGQKRIMSGLEITIKNADVMMKHFEAVKQLDEDQLKHEEGYLKSCMDGFITWCKDHDIEVPDWAK